MSTLSDIILTTNGKNRIDVISKSTTEVLVGNYEPSGLLAEDAQMQTGEVDSVKISFKGSVICCTGYGCFKNGDESESAFGTDVASTVTAITTFLSQ